MKRIVIIGGGISGLAAAHRILERSRETNSLVDVTLLEAGQRLGGIVQTEVRDGFLLERGPDSFISEKPQALELAKRLGLESQMIQTNAMHRRSFVVRRGKLLPVPEGFHLLAPGRVLPFLESDIFSWRGKARMAMDLLLPRAKNNGGAEGSDESLAHFVRRRFGREALERMAQPMVGGIYTADPETLSLRATMPRFLEMERKHRSLILALRRRAKGPESNSQAAKNEEGTSGARYSLFLSFDQGMQLLTDTLAKSVMTDTNSRQPSIRLNTSVESLQLMKENEQTLKWKVTTNGREAFLADAVCLALPAFAAARLMRGVDVRLASELEEISYASSATINLAYKKEDIPHPLNGFGFVVPFIEKRSILACTFSSVKFAGRAPDNCVLLRAFVGGALQSEMLDLTEGELISRVRSDLRDLLGIERAPMFAEVSKWENSMPQYHLGHLDRIQRIRQRLPSLPGLALAGNAYTGPGIPDCIRSGGDAAEALLSEETLQNPDASE